MTAKRRICVVVTARPSYSRVKTAMAAIQRHPELELVVIAAASALVDRYGNVAAQMTADGFSPNVSVHSLVDGESPLAMAKTAGMGTIEIASALAALRPDMVVTVADRYETISTAIAAAYMNIPLIHIQGGEVTGSIDEKVRHSITKLADLHLVATTGAAERVARMGEEKRSIHVTGCPSIDLAVGIWEQSALQFDPFSKYGGVGPKLDLSNGYFVVMQHPVTTEYQLAQDHISQTLEAVRELNVSTLWFWPNPDAGSDGTSKGIRQFRETHANTPIHFFRNFSPTDFLSLIRHSKALIGNSSVGIRESSFLGVPVVNIGTRQQGRDRAANVIDVDYSATEIVRAIRRHLSSDRPAQDHLYGDGRAGQRIAEVLAVAKVRTEKRLSY